MTPTQQTTSGTPPTPTLVRSADGKPGWVTLPNGQTMSYEGARDNGGSTFDRYTAGFEVTDPGLTENEDGKTDEFSLTIGPTGNCARGVCMSSEYPLSETDGVEIAWADLPAPVQAAIIGEFDLFVTSDCYSR
jgi:hypothetical protein